MAVPTIICLHCRNGSNRCGLVTLDRRPSTHGLAPELPKLVNTIVTNEDTTQQALAGGAIDRLLVKRGGKPFGARRRPYRSGAGRRFSGGRGSATSV